MKRRYTAALYDQRCSADVTLRGDDSPGQCMRKAVRSGLCLQHFKKQDNPKRLTKAARR